MTTVGNRSNDRIRVLYVTPSLGVGGAERSIVDMVEPLRSRGVDLVFAVRELRHEGIENALRTPPEVAPIGTGTLRWVPIIRRAIRKFHPDVVHTVLFEGDLAGRLAAVGTRVPVLSSIVNMSYETTRFSDPNIKRWRLECVRAIESVSGKILTRRFHAITQAARNAAVSRLGYPVERIDVVPRARDATRLGDRSLERRTEVRRSLGIHETMPMVLCVGRQEFQKAHDELLLAFPHVLRRVPEAHLFFAGREGNSTAGLRRLVQDLELTERTHWLGHREDVADLLAACDVFVFPSRFEGLGGAVIEALSLGCVIVSSDIPPLLEVLEGSNALFFEQGDIPALANAITRALTDEGGLALRAASIGPVLVRKRYSMDAVAEGMVSLYRRTISGGTNASA